MLSILFYFFLITFFPHKLAPLLFYCCSWHFLSIFFFVILISFAYKLPLLLWKKYTTQFVMSDFDQPLIFYCIPSSLWCPHYCSCLHLTTSSSLSCWYIYHSHCALFRSFPHWSTLLFVVLSVELTIGYKKTSTSSYGRAIYLHLVSFCVINNK